MKLIAIGGEPATGKSTLIKKTLIQLGDPSPFKSGLFRGNIYLKENVLILGIYDEKTFSGTDRLSMGVMKDLLLFLTSIKTEHPEIAILFEGDRLFNSRFLESTIAQCGQANTLALIIQSLEPEKDKRHIARKDTQSETFKKGRATKYKNLLSKYSWLQVESNNTYEDQARIVGLILSFVKNPSI
jgi:hypothetical protein